MTTYAQIETKVAALNSDFARSFVEKRYGSAATDLIYSLLPTFSRGPRKGKVKGYIRWDKVVRGGWVRGSSYDNFGAKGYVARPGRAINVAIVKEDSYAMTRFPDRSSFSPDMDEDNWLRIVRREVATVFNLKSELVEG